MAVRSDAELSRLLVSLKDRPEDRDSIQRAGRDLFASKVARARTAEAMVAAYMGTFADFIHAVFGGNPDRRIQAIENGLVNALACQTALALDLRGADLAAIAARVAMVANQVSPNLALLTGTVLTSLQTFHETRTIVEDYVRRLPKLQGKMLVSLRRLPDLGSLTEMANRLWEATIRLRTYGIKNVYWRDGWSHDPDLCWSYLDPNLLEERIIGSNCFWLHRAVVVISLGEAIAEEQVFTVTAGPKAEGRQAEGLIMPNTLFAFQISDDGTFDAGLGTGLMPMADIFQRLNRPTEWEVFRLLHLLHLYELLVPMSHVASPSRQPLPRPIGNSPEERSTWLRRLLHPDILLPRLREIRTLPRFEVALEREVDSALQEQASVEVTDHIRQLPPGFRPSQRARELARLHMNGRVLADHETYVQKHHRGSGPAIVKPHQAKSR